MKNIGLSNYAALITNDFNDLLTTYINPIPEFWNVHVLTPLYESPYHNGLTFSILFQLQGELLDYGLGRSVRFTDFMELKYQGNDILLIKSDGSSLLFKYDKTLFDQSYNIGIYINKETNSTLSAIDDRYGYRWRIHTHDNDSYEFQPNGSKILLSKLVKANQEIKSYKYDSKRRIVEIQNNSQKVEKITFSYNENYVEIKAYKTNTSNVFEEIKYIKIILETNDEIFNNFIKQIFVYPNENSTIIEKNLEFEYTNNGFVTYKIIDKLTNLFIQFEVTPTLKPEYYQNELGARIDIWNDNPYCATINSYRNVKSIYHSDKEGNLICISEDERGLVQSILYDELHRKLVISKLISYNPSFNGEVLEPFKIYCNSMYVSRELIPTPNFLAPYYPESKCWKFTAEGAIGKYFQIYEINCQKFDVFSLGIWLRIAEYNASVDDTQILINVYFSNEPDKNDNCVAWLHSINIKAKYIPDDFEYFMTIERANAAYKYLIVELGETIGGRTICTFIMDLYKNGLAQLNDFDENNNVIEIINGNNVKNYVYNIDNTLSSSVSVNFEYDHHGNVIRSVNGYGTMGLYEYDDSNNLLKSEMKNSTGSLISTAIYEDEEVIINNIDINNIETNYKYTPVYILNEEILPNSNNKTLNEKYEYNGPDYELLKKKLYQNENNVQIGNIFYDYNNARLLTTINCNNSSLKYNNGYDEYFRLTSFKLNDKSFINFTYETYNGYQTYLLKTIQFGNKDLYEYNYDQFEQLISINYKKSINSSAVTKFTYKYNEIGDIVKIKDNENNIIYKYEYDKDRNLSAFYYKITNEEASIDDFDFKIEEFYDADQRLILSNYNILGNVLNTSTQSIFKEYANSIEYYKYHIRNTKDMFLCMFDDFYFKVKTNDSYENTDFVYPQTKICLINNNFLYSATNSSSYNDYCLLEGMLNYYNSNGNNSINFDFSKNNLLGNKQSIALSFLLTRAQNEAKLISLSDGTNNIEVIINSINKITICLNSNLLFTSSYQINHNEYHFMCLTYDFENHNITLKVNNNSNSITFNQNINQIQELNFVIGFYGTITNIIIPKENIISDEDYEKYLKSFNLLLAINNQRILSYENDIIKVSSKEILPNLNNHAFIPLNNGTAGIKNNKIIRPVFDDVVDLPCIGSPNTEFVFNNEINKYAYYAMGQMLVYDTGLSDEGTITFKYCLLHIDNENTLFELVSSNNFSITFSIKDKIFLLKTPNAVYEFDINYGINEINEWNTITFSWSLKEDSTEPLYNINVYINTGLIGNIDYFQMPDRFNNLQLYLGRNANFDDHYGNCLNGLIESLIFFDKFLKDDINYFRVNETNEVLHKYNDLNLLQEKIIIDKGQKILENKYYYIMIDDTRYSTLVSKEQIGDHYNYSYKYDERGNIIEITRNLHLSSNVTKYEYDNMGRLVLENKNGEIKKYSYDNNGNILEITNNSEIYHKFTYDKDGLLISVDNTKIEYDSQNTLNPVKIGNNITLSYECGNLVSYEDKENNIYNKYYYNQNNYRIRKEIYNQNGQLTDVIYFFYDLNNKLIGQKSNSVTLIFLYDELDQLNGFIYNGEKYYYLIDALGIIKGIIDANGNLKVEYSYDTWGRKITDNIVKLGKINPFRYKCYYYDDETQLYWVSSRYYSPELCRWISPDSIEYLDPQSINGLNLYCYCGNNPVM